MFKIPIRTYEGIYMNSDSSKNALVALINQEYI